ncbi:MAG TPA: LLM class flavin-dependent oxidoreductase [Stellaceae bacterium]|nr:LLM class flavin-dependent oxidoreductase [Stellaceae bacterium]
MSARSRQMKLGAFLWPCGHHVAAWRHPQGVADGGLNFPFYAEMAQLAERGLFDLLFAADRVCVAPGDPDIISHMSYVAWLEPFTLFSALAAVTRRIGLVFTVTTTYEEPYHIARRFASLDHISGGRSGWNLVTSAQAAEAHNFSRDAHPPKEERYERAREFARVVRGLWDSWDDDAFARDKESGLFFHPEKMHVLDHNGPLFSVRGPLNVARSPQGQPVMVQAGASDDGRDLAAETAEVVFTAHQRLSDAQEFYADVKARMAKYGREPDDMKIMPGIFATVGRTEQEARDKYEQLQELIHPKVGVMLLSQFMAFDLSPYPIDGPLPEMPENKVVSSRRTLLTDLAQRENLTIRQLYLRMAGARGHRTIYGTPTQIADELEEWFTKAGADGFNIMPPVLPGSLVDFVDMVIPELQRRGLFRTQYEGRTLRENLGLRRPESLFVTARA